MRRAETEPYAQLLRELGYDAEVRTYSGKNLYDDGWLFCGVHNLYFRFRSPPPRDRLGRIRCPLCGRNLRATSRRARGAPRAYIDIPEDQE